MTSGRRAQRKQTKRGKRTKKGRTLTWVFKAQRKRIQTLYAGGDYERKKEAGKAMTRVGERRVLEGVGGMTGGEIKIRERGR